mgnify:CR=1 FL=1
MKNWIKRYGIILGIAVTGFNGLAQAARVDVDIDNDLRVAGGVNISGDLGVSGRVGVGTLSPKDNLEVVGSARVSALKAYFTSTVAGAAYIKRFLITRFSFITLSN